MRRRRPERLPHPRTDLRLVYLPEGAAAPEEQLRRLEEARDAPLTDYPAPRWIGVWARPYGDAVLGVTRQRPSAVR